jgi:hypothetical protein
MRPALTLLAAALLVIAALGAWLWRLRREVQRLRQRGEATACNLETLQTSFARFVPSEVIERVITSGVSPGAERAPCARSSRVTTRGSATGVFLRSRSASASTAEPDLDPRFVLRPMAAASLRGIGQPVATYCVERFEGESP